MVKNNKGKDIEKGLKLIAKSSIIVFIGLILSKVFTLVYRIIIARHFGPEVYGLFSLLLMVGGLIVAFSSLGLTEGILRYISLYRGKKEKDKIKYLFKKSLIFLFFSGIFSGAILFFLSEFLAINIFHEPGLIIFLKVFAIAIPIVIFLDIFVSAIRAFEKIGAHSFIFNIFQGGIKPLLLGVFIFLGFNSNSVVFSYVLGIVITFILSYIYCKYKLPQLFGKYFLKDKTKKIITREVFSFSWPVMFVGILGFIFYWTDSFLIGYLKGAFEVGIYNSATPIVGLLTIASTLFLKLFFPLIVKEYSKKNINLIKELSKQVGKWIFIINFPIFILVLLFPGVIIKLLFGGEYLFAINALRFLSIGAIITSVFSVSHNLILMVGKSKILLFNIILTSGLNIILNFVLVPMPYIFGLDNSLGINGAAIATMISIVVFNFLLLFQARKYTSIIPLRRKMIKITFVAILPTILLLYFRSIIPINYLTMIILGSFFILFYLFLIFITRCLDRNDLMILKTIKKKIINI